MKRRRKKLRNMIRKPREKRAKPIPPAGLNNADNLANLANKSANLGANRPAYLLHALGISPLGKRELTKLFAQSALALLNGEIS